MLLVGTNIMLLWRVIMDSSENCMMEIMIKSYPVCSNVVIFILSPRYSIRIAFYHPDHMSSFCLCKSKKTKIVITTQFSSTQIRCMQLWICFSTAFVLDSQLLVLFLGQKVLSSVVTILITLFRNIINT